MKLTQHGDMPAMPEGGDGKPIPPRPEPRPEPRPVPREAAGRNLLFLREDELRLGQDLLFFGYRDFTAGADAILAEMDLGRAHHRVLHFVGRRPGLTVGELLGVLGITKQSLARVLTPLMEGGLVIQTAGRADRRQRLLRLTEAGAVLERRLYERQRETLTRAYREAGPDAVDGFRRVMRGLMGPDARSLLDRPFSSGGPAGGAAGGGPGHGGKG